MTGDGDVTGALAGAVVADALVGTTSLSSVVAVSFPPLSKGTIPIFHEMSVSPPIN